MKEKGRERTEETGITTLLCSEHRSLESADVLLQDNQYTYWCFQQSVLRLKKYKLHPIKSMLPTTMSTASHFGISGVSCHGSDIDNKQDIAASRRYKINAESEM